jgi:2-isopropylmalate synthase
MTEMGFDLSEDELNRAFMRFKELADKKKEVTTMDLASIVNDEIQPITEDRFKLSRVQVLCGDAQVPTATVTIFDAVSSGQKTLAATGTGPVDAAYNAINTNIGIQDVTLQEYTVSSVTAGIDALGEVTVRLQDAISQRTFFGRAANTDVVVASAQAYVNAINRLFVARQDQAVNPIHPQYSRGV